MHSQSFVCTGACGWVHTWPVVGGHHISRVCRVFLFPRGAPSPLPSGVPQARAVAPGPPELHVESRASRSLIHSSWRVSLLGPHGMSLPWLCAWGAQGVILCSFSPDSDSSVTLQLLIPSGNVGVDWLALLPAGPLAPVTPPPPTLLLAVITGLMVVSSPISLTLWICVLYSLNLLTKCFGRDCRKTHVS